MTVLAEMLGYVREGDTVVVSNMDSWPARDRAARTRGAYKGRALARSEFVQTVSAQMAGR